MPTIDTRRELAQHLQGQMAAAGRGPFASLDEDADGGTMLKTYLVESHAAHAAGGTAAGMRSLAKQLGISLRPGDEPDLFTLSGGGATLWCDTSMGRFWRLHAIARVEESDKLRDELVASVPWLDNVWLPPKYLERLPDKFAAEMLTFSLSHDRRQLHRSDAPDLGGMDAITMRLWASHAERTLRALRQHDIFPHGIAVRSVKMRTGTPDPDAQYCVAEYFRNGKITASGTSFDEHNRMLVQVLRDYQALVEGIERRYALGVRDENGCRCLSGEPVTIDLSWTAPDLEYAVARIFSGTEPFRLWALPERLGPDHFRAIATDLHVGGVLTFDITPENVVIQLPDGVCGNTIVRFMNNLRYHVNADVVGPA